MRDQHDFDKTRSARFHLLGALLDSRPLVVLETESDANKIMRIVEHGTKLGLKYPSEPTWASITSLVMHLPGCGFRKGSFLELHHAYLLSKKYGKSVLSTADATASNLPYVDKLPSNPVQLDPCWLSACYGDVIPDLTPPACLNLNAIQADALNVPQRLSRKELQEGSRKNAKKAALTSAKDVRQDCGAVPLCLEMLRDMVSAMARSNEPAHKKSTEPVVQLNLGAARSSSVAPELKDVCPAVCPTLAPSLSPMTKCQRPCSPHL